MMTITSGSAPGKGSLRDVRQSSWLDLAIRVGLVSYGVVHLLIAWIALQIAWGQENQAASSTGALQELAQQPLGEVLLWVVAFGFVAMVVWMALEAIWGYADEEQRKRIGKRLTCAARGIVYALLAATAFSTATSSSQSSSGSSNDAMTAQLMEMPGGQLVVALIGVGVVAVGVALIVRGIGKKFEHNLQPEAKTGTQGTVIVRSGQVGYTAKGVSLGVVGGLFIWAAWTYDPHKAGGLDVALRTLLKEPYGAWLLTAVALGIGAFGLYCFAWARYPARLRK